MIPGQLSGFFVAGTGAAAALLGLVFVAISINPERIFGATSTAHAIATNAVIALADAFFVAFAALLSPGTCAWVALGFGLFAFIGTLGLAYTLIYQELNLRLVAQRIPLILASFVIYGLQCWFAAELLLTPNATWPAYGLAHTLLAVFALGGLRGYQLLCAHLTGLRAWLGPRHYTIEGKALDTRPETDGEQPR